MRIMAGNATLGLYRRMLKNEGAGILGVALDANLVLRGGGTQLFIPKRPVGIMAICTIHQPFIHPMVKWALEIWLDISMTGVAKRWLRS